MFPLVRVDLAFVNASDVLQITTLQGWLLLHEAERRIASARAESFSGSTGLGPIALLALLVRIAS